MKEALLYDVLDNENLKCRACAHECVIKPEDYGICKVRKNLHGKLYVLSYGRVVAECIDPIEKKPLFHFMPGTNSYSIATPGCNLRCLFCLNARISQVRKGKESKYGKNRTAEEIVEQAVIHKCPSISYTYTEPTISLEFTLEVMKLARLSGVMNVLVSNGFMSYETRSELLPLVDAANIDLKSFRDEFYRRVCGARLSPVLDTIVEFKKAGVWIEIATPIIPGYNDDPAEIKDMADFIVSLGTETPWHVSRFHPAYRLMSVPITSVAMLTKAREIGMERGLKYVYIGNVPGEDGENTFCPHCQNIVIRRVGFASKVTGLENGCCKYCGQVISGIWIN